MIDRLRALLNRPVRESRRRVVFALCVVVIALGVVVMSRLADSGPPSGPGRLEPPPSHQSGTDEGYEVTNPPVVSHDDPGDVPSEDGLSATPVTPEEVRQVRRAARRFLEGYLAFTYGHARARDIEAAGPELIARLEADPPRVPPAVRRRRPRIELVTQEDTGKYRAAATATINDGVTRYMVRLQLRRTGPRDWVVADLGV